MKACEIIADKDKKKFKLIPIDGGKVKKEKFKCSSTCSSKNWIKMLV